MNVMKLSRVVQKSYEYQEKESEKIDESIECEWYVGVI